MTYKEKADLAIAIQQDKLYFTKHRIESLEMARHVAIDSTGDTEAIKEIDNSIKKSNDIIEACEFGINELHCALTRLNYRGGEL